MKRAIVPMVLVCLLALFAGTAMAEGIVSMNKASVAELTAIEDIDVPEDIAQAIVKYREANGPYQYPEDLQKVPGMTQDFLEELNPQEMDGDVVFDPDAEPALAPSKC